MRPEARLIIILLILVSFSSTARAREFIAVTDGGRKDPATGGSAGYARDLNIPGIVDGRLDTVLIPSGITVYYEGGQRRGLAHPLPFEPNLFMPAEEDMLFMTEMEIPPGTPGLERRLRLTIETDGLTATGKVVLAK